MLLSDGRNECTYYAPYSTEYSEQYHTQEIRTYESRKSHDFRNNILCSLFCKNYQSKLIIQQNSLSVIVAISLPPNLGQLSKLKPLYFNFLTKQQGSIDDPKRFIDDLAETIVTSANTTAKDPIPGRLNPHAYPRKINNVNTIYAYPNVRGPGGGKWERQLPGH